MEQAPGPRGSPHDPQAPGEAEAGELPFALTANTESCGASFTLWHLGHCAFSAPYTNASKGCSQSLQMYSKIGMTLLLTARLDRHDHLKSNGGVDANENPGIPAAT